MNNQLVISLAQLLGQEITDLLSPSQFQSISAAYLEPWRTYHNIEHPIAMLEALAKLDCSMLTTGQLLAIKLMILYHDVWYKVGRNSGENELESACWARHDLEPGSTPNHLTSAVAMGINCSTSHLVIGDAMRAYQPAIKLFLDLDLMTLGGTAEEFDQGTESIWQEYQPHYSRDEYDTGRRAWAREMLHRKHIYQTEYFAHLEAPARANLQRLIDAT
jgi:predicted metal-dependent HD superfamily phosphohydrolase